MNNSDSCEHTRKRGRHGHCSACIWDAVRAEVAELRAKLSDREARLRAVRKLVVEPVADATYADADLFMSATNIRRKNWRKP